MAELENIEEPPQKRSRPNEDENGATNDATEAEEDEDDDEEEEVVLVAGKTVPLQRGHIGDGGRDDRRGTRSIYGLLCKRICITNR
ncbi:hypothetical protein OSTOST_13272 [Ostertagia ostertagi]